MRSRGVLATILLTTATVTGCGAEGRSVGPLADPSPSHSSAGAEWSLVESLFLDPDGRVLLCETTLYSAPPQCGGEMKVVGVTRDEVIDVVGAWAADDRFTSPMRLVGRWSGASWVGSTFTVTRPVELAPAGARRSDSEPKVPIDFPSLCDSPLPGQARTKLVVDAGSWQPNADPNVVDSWVANGRDAYNFIVRRDAQEFAERAAQVLPGSVCVREADERVLYAERLAGRQPNAEELHPAPQRGQLHEDLEADGLVVFSVRRLREHVYASVAQATDEQIKTAQARYAGVVTITSWLTEVSE